MVRVFGVAKIGSGIVSHTQTGEVSVEMEIHPDGLETDTLPVGLVLPDGFPLRFQLPVEAVPLLRKTFEDLEFLLSGGGGPRFLL